jgi:hypothetical protein
MDRSVMSQNRSSRTRPLLALAVCALAFGLTVASASAASFGELARFGKNGKGAGQFTNSFTVHALGVDPTDNSVYVGDEPKSTENSSEYRIQKFSSSGTLLGSVSFTIKTDNGEGGAPAGLQGIAVDPSLGRVYALVVYERKEEEGPKGLLRVDPEVEAAGTLFAFSTTPNGSKELVAASGAPGGVLANKEVLLAQSEVVGKPTESALLEPSGITVDPTTKEVVILGQEDQGEEFFVAAQRVHSDGTLGTRWVDTTQCFEGEKASPLCPAEAGEEPEPVGEEPNSPVALPNGKILVEMPGGSEVWELPTSFTTGQPPKQVLAFALPQQNLLSFPGGFTPKEGGGMSFVHESGEGADEGRLYLYSSILRATNKQRAPGVLAFKVSENAGATQASEIGWTGGANVAEHAECTINALSLPTVAAGTGESIYVFDPARPSIAEEQKGASVNPHVVEFGPKGSGCPAPSADGPTATQSGVVLGSEKSPLESGKKTALTSNVSEGNVLKAEWNFGDGSPVQLVSEYQFQTSRVEHTFTAPGSHEVTETLTTDDLAAPVVVKKVTLFVKSGAPTAQFSGPSEAAVGQTVTFDGKGSVDPEGKALTYVWKFGDGAETTTKVSSASHAYSTAGTYAVGLQVSDGTATSPLVTHTIKVGSSGGGGGGGETGGGGGNGGGGGGGGGGGETGGGTGSNTTSTTTKPATTVLGSQQKQGNPAAALAGTSISVSSSGSLVLKVSCPAGETSCSGTVTLRTLGAVKAQVKATVLTLATGSFTVPGGSSKAVTLHLSSKAKKLLAHAHSLKAKATLLAHDSTGATRTTLATVTLKPAKKPAHH